jgi:hypothetical protein
MKCPDTIDDARVICHTGIDARHQHTGNTRHIVSGQLVGPVNGLAICQYSGDTAFYLFSCDATWCSIADTCHESLAEARHQAEFEYVGVSSTWTFKP